MKYRLHRSTVSVLILFLGGNVGTKPTLPQPTHPILLAYKNV